MIDLYSYALWTSTVGSTDVMIGLGIIVGIVLWIKRFRREGFAMILSVLLASASVLILKNIFQVARPINGLEFDYSFPSGHATLAAAFFCALAFIAARHIRNKKERIVLSSLFTLIVIAIGWSRIILGVHWPIDVIAGWSLGVVCAWVVVRVVTKKS